MITFSSQNVDGLMVQWEFASVDDLEEEYWGDADLPANDDEIYDLRIGGVSIFIDGVIGSLPVFSDLIRLLGLSSN